MKVIIYGLQASACMMLFTALLLLAGLGPVNARDPDFAKVVSKFECETRIRRSSEQETR
jgi:hypothetical protein